MQRFRDTFRKKQQPILEIQAQQHYLQRQKQSEAIHQNVESEHPSKADEESKLQSKAEKLEETTHKLAHLSLPEQQQLGLTGKQIKSVSYDEIRLRESGISLQEYNEEEACTSGSDANRNVAMLDVASTRSIRSRSFDSATARSHANVAASSSSAFLEIPKWKILVRRSSSGSSSGSETVSRAKDCVHCALIEEYTKAIMSPPLSAKSSFSSEESSVTGEESDHDISEADTAEIGSQGASGGSVEVEEGEEFDEDVAPIKGLPIVTLCPPPEISEIVVEDEDNQSGVTVVQLEVPVYDGKQIRSASVDSPFLLQVPKRTDIEDGERPPKAHRSRSVDIALPAEPGQPYILVPSQKPGHITTK